MSSRASQDFKLVLILFISFRLMMLVAFTPEAIISYGDYEHYYNLARLSDDGHLPLLDYWYEFPPIFPYLSIGIYQLTAAATGALHSYAYALAVVMLAFDVGNLILLYRLAGRLWSERVAVRTAWVYLALPVGMIYTWRTFDSMTTFWMLLALYWLLERKENRSAVALGLGVMTKYIPILLLPAVWAFRPVKTALRYTLITLAVALLIFGPFLIASPEFGLASLKAQAAKSSWQTVWALIDGNYGTGNVGPDMEHFDPALATKLQGRPERIPSWLTLLPFAAIGLYFFRRARGAKDERRTTNGQSPIPNPQSPIPNPRSPSPIPFITLTFTLFLLWSKGWSPQWQMMLFPLVLLALPGRNGVLFCILFGMVNFLEWPALLSRGMTEWIWLTVSLRTTLILALGVALGRMILTRPKPEMQT